MSRNSDISPGALPTPVAAGQAAAPGGSCHLSNDKPSVSSAAVLELRVRNHPGPCPTSQACLRAAISISRQLSACRWPTGPRAACCCWCRTNLVCSRSSVSWPNFPTSLLCAIAPTWERSFLPADRCDGRTTVSHWPAVTQTYVVPWRRRFGSRGSSAHVGQNKRQTTSSACCFCLERYKRLYWNGIFHARFPG